MSAEAELLHRSWTLRARAAAALCLAVIGPPARAQQAGWTPSASASAALDLAAGPNPVSALPIGPFLVDPKLTIGTAFTDNLLASATHRVAAAGLELAPSLTVNDDEDLHKTSLYFNADAQLYPGANAPASRRAQAAIFATADRLWSPTPDISADVSIAYLRNDSPFAPATSDAQTFAATPASAGVAGAAQYFDLGAISGWVEKRLAGGVSARLGAGMQDLAYEPAAGSRAQGGRDASAYLRLSAPLTPTVHGFAEAGEDLRRYGAPASNANAARAIVGANSDLIGLARGEIYAGVQRQNSAQGAFGATTSPTAGALIAYYPTRALTILLSASRALSSTRLAAPAGALAAPLALTDEARLEATYALAEYWSASVRAGFARSTYRAPATQDRAVTFGAGLEYRFWRQAAATLSYAYTRTRGPEGGYVQNVATAGLTYRY